MGWRTVVVTGIAKLEYRIDNLVVRKQSGVTRIHIDEIELLIVESTQVSMTAELLAKLVDNKVKVILCDSKHNPSAELVSYYGSHDTSGKIRTQVSWSAEAKMNVGSWIITEKIRQQRDFVYELGHVDEAQVLTEYLNEVSLGDPSNREAHAAKTYFRVLFGKEFTRNSDSSINAALNYGYGIMLALFNREIVSNGYITQLGLIHVNQFNQFNLASDLMEPFRIIVDRKVKNIKPVKFEHDEKMQVLGIMSEQVTIDGYKRYLSDAVSVYCKSIFNALEDGNIDMIKTFSYEL